MGSSQNLGGKSSLGARLRTRKVTGRDASLPAPLLSAFEMLVARGTVGALPQTPQGTLSLDPARGNFPLDPFARLSWSRFHAPSACSFLALRLSSCLLPQLSVKNHKKSPAGSGIAPLDQPGFLIHFFSSASGISTVMINQPSCCSSVMQPAYFSAALRMLLMP